MKIVIPDDYQNAVRSLACFQKLAGYEVTVYNDVVKNEQQLIERFQNADVLVLIRERTAITRSLVEALPSLKLISQTGRGIPHIDLDACTEHGVAVVVGTGSPCAPAELTWGLILASMRRIPQEAAALKAGRWQTTPGIGIGLRGRALGILGYGKIGSLVAGYGRVFGMNILIHGREGSVSRAHTDGFETVSNQRALFEQSDVLSIHLKLVNETRGMVTRDDLAAMKSSALLVNTSRAELIAPDALIEALKAGRPGFAAVDVYESEPILDPGHPLLQMDNVLATPHLGYVEKDSYELYFGSAFDHVQAFFTGHPEGIVNPAALSPR